MRPPTSSNSNAAPNDDELAFARHVRQSCARGRRDPSGDVPYIASTYFRPAARMNPTASDISPSASDLIARLGLEPHPEGGWYREVHRSVVRAADARAAREPR